MIKVHITIVTFDYASLRLQCADHLPYVICFFTRNFGYLIEQNNIAKFNLLNDKILDILFLYILTVEASTRLKFISKTKSINHGHYAIKTNIRCVARGLNKMWHGMNGLRYRLRFAYTARFYNNIIKLIAVGKIGQLLYQIALQSAADTTVLKRNKAIILTSNHATLCYQFGIYVDFSNVIYYYRKLYPPFIIQNSIQ